MPNEFQQPFDKTTRSGADPELVAGVLGTGAQEEMDELVGKQEDPGDQTTSEGLELTADEAVATEQAEQAPIREKRRQQYIEWAEKFGKDAEWVNQEFVFELDGNVTSDGYLFLDDEGVSELPPNLVEAEKGVLLGSNKLVSLKGMPRIVGEFLDLAYNPLEFLMGLPKDIGGDLRLQGVPATEIPAGLNIGGVIELKENQTELIADCQAKGYSVKVK